jgi:hypothetical protein
MADTISLASQTKSAPNVREKGGSSKIKYVEGGGRCKLLSSYSNGA